MIMLKPKPDGSGWTVSFPEWSHQFFIVVGGQVRDLLVEGDSDLLRRLYPTAYVGDKEANDAFDELVHDDLLASRLQALETLEESLTATEATEGDLVVWMQAINSMRLVVGTRLDVSEDDHPDIDQDHPDAPLWEMYEILSLFLDRVITALGEAM